MALAARYFMLVPRTKLARTEHTRRLSREQMETRARVARAEAEARFWNDQTEARRIEEQHRQRRDAEIAADLAETRKRLDRMMSGASLNGMVGAAVAAEARGEDPLAADVLKLAKGELLADDGDGFRIEDEDDIDKALAAGDEDEDGDFEDE